jgi:hypothetical protein
MEPKTLAGQASLLLREAEFEYVPYFGFRGFAVGPHWTALDRIPKQLDAYKVTCKGTNKDMT